MKIVVAILILLSSGLVLYVDINKSDQGIVDILRDVWPSLFVISFVSIIIEWQFKSRDRRREGLIERGLENIPRHTAKEVLIAIADKDVSYGLLKSYFGSITNNQEKSEHLIRKISSICSDEKFVTDQISLIRLLPNSKELYWLDVVHRMRLSHPRKGLLVAVTCDETVATKLSNYSPEVDLILDPSNYDASLSHFDWKNLISVTVCNSEDFRTPSGSSSFELDPATVGGILSRVGLKDSAACRLFLYNDADDKNKKDHFYRLQTRIAMKLSDGYIYLSVDRLTFMNKISIDYSEIRESIYDIKAKSFMMSDNLRLINDHEKGVVNANIDDWVFPGHGIVVMWRTR